MCGRMTIRTAFTVSRRAREAANQSVVLRLDSEAVTHMTSVEMNFQVELQGEGRRVAEVAVGEGQQVESFLQVPGLATQ